MVPVGRMVADDPTLKILYDQPAETELTRSTSSEPWRWIVDDKVVDEDGRIIVRM